MTEINAYVTMAIGDDRLPTSIMFDQRWKSSLYPNEYGQSILAAYQRAQWEHDGILMRRAVEENDMTFRLVKRIPRRERLLILLRTSSMREWNQVNRELLAKPLLDADGSVMTRWDEAAVQVGGSRSGLERVFIDSEWGQQASPESIGGEILTAIDALRAKLTPSYDFYDDGLSDEALERRHQEHLDELMIRRFAS